MALKIEFDLKSLLALVLIGPGEFILLSTGIGYFTSLWIPRELRNFAITSKVFEKHRESN